ncbi:MAG: hypothetical protein WAW17_28225 [Rhodococcus sp. (in: high G+C Gram-positive bacteria)]|uniref:hypothetical protein n=1 Tax=Rhodococcus sp. TaxID=1831 RepID=UPI003BB0D851
MTDRADRLRARRAHMRAELELFRQRQDELRLSEATAVHSARSIPSESTVEPVSSPTPDRERPDLDDDDDFYRPRSWLV